MSGIDLRGRVVLVTGASRGIGAAVAMLAAEAGADVALVARSADALEGVAARVRAGGRRALVIEADLSRNGADGLVENVIAELGPIHLLVNNAAVLAPLAPLWRTDESAWEANINLNLLAAYRMMRAVMPAMVNRGEGRVLNVSSGVASEVLLGWTAYSAAKAGLDHLTRVAGAEAAPHGVGVAAVWPGNVDTAMQAVIRELDPQKIDPADHERFQRLKLEGRLRPPEEAAHFALRVATLPLQEMAGRIFNISTGAPI